MFDNVITLGNYCNDPNSSASLFSQLIKIAGGRVRDKQHVATLCWEQALGIARWAGETGIAPRLGHLVRRLIACVRSIWLIAWLGQKVEELLYPSQQVSIIASGPGCLNVEEGA